MTAPSNAVVICLGMGTVFAGLICIVLLCYIMSAVCNALVKKTSDASASAESAPAVSPDAQIANKQEIVAAACAVIAEEIGTQANNIRVLSFKRI
ncbi:MAG: OadG family protein [Firmicutes bacterium]|nr:OadG family protein [Bacillota bacterium]